MFLLLFAFILLEILTLLKVITFPPLHGLQGLNTSCQDSIESAFTQWANLPFFPSFFRTDISRRKDVSSISSIHGQVKKHYLNITLSKTTFSYSFYPKQYQVIIIIPHYICDEQISTELSKYDSFSSGNNSKNWQTDLHENKMSFSIKWNHD